MREENRPSFRATKYNGGWRWKGLGAKEEGGIIKFVKLYQGVGFPKAIRVLLEEECRPVTFIGKDSRNEGCEETRLKKADW